MTLNLAREKYSQYRQRGYTCGACHRTVIIYSQDPAPTECSNCMSHDIKKAWDHLVTDHTTVADYKEA